MANEIDPKLIKEIAEHNCIFFIGAGLSHTAGMPLSSQLAEKLAEKLNSELKRMEREDIIKEVKTHKNNLQEVAEIYHNVFRDHKVKEEIVRIIETFQKNAKNEIFDIISQLPWNDFITTNYDTLLEDSIDPLSKTVIWHDDQISQYKLQLFNIFKIHGTINDPSSIRVLKDDFIKFRETSIYKVLVGELQKKTLVLIGYSAQDYTFRELYFEAKPNKDLYIITKKKEAMHEEWINKGARIIEMDAYEFLEKIVDEIRKYTNISIEEVPHVPSSVKPEDCNPFKYYTTDGLIPDDFLELSKAFVPPYYAGFEKILSPEKHHIIQGARGTGKTILLRSLSLEVTAMKGEKYNFIGFWIPLSTKFLGCVKRKEMEEIDWYKFFASYLTLLIMEHSLQSLCILEEKGIYKFDKKSVEKFIQNIARDIEIEIKADSLCSLKDEIGRIRGKYHTAYNREKFQLPIDPDYLSRYVSYLQNLHESLSNKYVFIILDDTHCMDEDQKKVLVSFINQRKYPISIKLSSKDEFGVYTDFFGATVQEGDDFEKIELDLWVGEKGAQQYYSFLEQVGNVRLQLANQNITIEELLPPRETPLKKGEDYSGFRNIVRLSSQVPRDFITIVKDIIYYAYPEIINKRIELKPIPPHIQNEVIFMKSAIHLRLALNESSPFFEEMQLLLTALGELFKRTLEVSTRRGQPRTVSGIEIKGYSSLHPKAKKVIEKAIELQLLQRPMLDRLRIPWKIPLFGLKLHRLLCPYFRLKLAYRWPRTVDYRLLNYLLCGETIDISLFPREEDPEKRKEIFVNTLLQTLESEKEESPAVQMEIDFYLNSEETK